MKFIELTSSDKGQKFFVNPKMIGHVYPRTHSITMEIIGSNVGVVTHNNGGFNVSETPEQIINKIETL